MIVVGGKGFEATWFPPNGPPTDPWAQGLGILDLPSLSWRDHYDPNAGPYDSPDMVKEFYNKGYVSMVCLSKVANSRTVGWHKCYGQMRK